MRIAGMPRSALRSPCVGRCGAQVRKECSAARVFTIFRALGLRHMCVVDADHCPIGMITRQNLMHSPDSDDED